MELQYDTEQEAFATADIAATPTQEPTLQICCAGAGTGKTTTLQKRVANLIDQGAAPAGIYAITFTRAAARALREKIGDIGYIGTIHGLARLHVAPGKAVMDDDATEEIIRETINETGLKMSVSAAKAILQSGHDDHLGNAKVFLRTFEAKVDRIGEMPHDLILRRFAFGPVEHFARPRILIVDEFQDTSPLDMAAFHRIRPTRAFIAIGDPRQSIYRFRGANPTIFKRLIREARADMAFSLSTTYRCSRAVIRAANRVHEHQDGFEPLRPAPGAEDGRVECRHFGTAREEEDAILEEIRSFAILDGNGTIAVLTRYNEDCERIRLAARAAGWRIEPRVADDRTRAKAIEEAVRKHLEYFTGDISTEDFLAGISANQRSHILLKWGHPRRFEEAVALAATITDKMARAWAPDEIRTHYLVEEASLRPNWHGAIARTEEVINDQVDTKGPAIFIDTVHAVKGLEFDRVILAQADERWDTRNDDDDQAENLVYVAITRARRSFLATFAENVIDPWSGMSQKRRASNIIRRAMAGE